MRPYELMYLIQPTADEERLTAVSERLQQSIGSLGGKVDKVTPPVRCGLLAGTADLAFAALGHRSSLRWALVGVVVSSVAVGTGLAIAFAPLGYEPSHAVPRPWQTPPDRPNVPPPARPGRGWLSACAITRFEPKFTSARARPSRAAV